MALARLAGAALRSRGMDALPLLLVAKVIFLLAFFVLAVALGPFPDSDSPAALLDRFRRHRRHGDPERGAARSLRSHSADDADDRKHHPGRAGCRRPDAAARPMPDAAAVRARFQTNGSRHRLVRRRMRGRCPACTIGSAFGASRSRSRSAPRPRSCAMTATTAQPRRSPRRAWS